MLQHATNGQTAFEVSLYNRDVRSAVKDNRSHDFYGDHWADAQLQDVLAGDEQEALKLISRRYPPDRGFVVQSLNVIED